MNVTIIEDGLFDTMLRHVEKVADKLEELDSKTKAKTLNDWMDSQDVCLLLDITPRTLQTYRDCGKLPFTQIKGKALYKPADVEKLLIRKE